jgi:citrate synthase
MEMLEYMKAEINNPDNDDEVRDYLCKIVKREKADRSGLIYGMGHAVYTLSDPRAPVLREKARSLIGDSKYAGELMLLEAVERLAPGVMKELKGVDAICANVDLYSGLVYKYLDIPYDLFTPLFAIARMTGWCAHRIEELLFNSRIIRPAYKAVSALNEYIPLDKRG